MSVVGNDYTKKNADLFNENLHRISRTITPTTTIQYIGIIGRKFKLRQFWFIPDGAGSSPANKIGIYRGSTLAVADGQLALQAATAQGGTAFSAGVISAVTAQPMKTRTDANVDGAAGDFVGCKIDTAAGTWPAGLVIVEFVLRDA